MMTNLQRLRELTEQMDHSHFIPDHQDGNVFNYNFNGEVSTEALAHSPEMAMAKLTMAKGTVFPQHTHTMLEIFIIITGKVEFYMCDETWNVSAGQPLYTLPNVPHGGKALEDTVMLTITVPADPSYPFVRCPDAGE